MTAQPLFCFVVPCFNEEDNVGPTVDSIRHALGARDSYEIILVDDCSRDRTLARMQALARADPRIRVVLNEVNLSMGGAYKSGLSIATAKYVMMLPGDDGFPPKSIAEILSHAGEPDIIIPIVTNQGVLTPFPAFPSNCYTPMLHWIFWL